MSPADLIVKLLSDGSILPAITAIVALIAAPGWLAWWWERRAHQKTTAHLVDVSVGTIEAITKMESTLDTNNRVMEKSLERD